MQTPTLQYKSKWGVRGVIRITCPCDVYPLTPHFYIVKLGFTGYTLFSDFDLKHIL